MTSESNSVANLQPQNSPSNFVSSEVTNIKQLEASNVPALLIQQRQILAMMGLDIWVQRDRHSLSVDYDAYRQQHEDKTPSNIKPSHTKPFNAKPATGSQPHPTKGDQAQADQSLQSKGPGSTDSKPAANSQPMDTAELTRNPIQALKQKLEVDDNKTTEVRVSLAESLEQVDPFEIVGVHFKEWVLIADVSVFKEEPYFRLWENITNALSLTPQSLKFPICEGISDKEAANASVAGFIFNLAKNNEIKVAALTAMPNGIEHSNIQDMPKLSEMLADSKLKRQLWQRLNQNHSG